MVHVLAVPEMPLAHQVAGVSHLPQVLRHGHVLGLQTPGVTGDKGNPEPHIGGVAASQQSRPGRGAGWVHVVIVKSEKETFYQLDTSVFFVQNLLDRFFRKFVNIFGDKGCVRICEAHICVSLVICHSKQYSCEYTNIFNQT